MKKIILFINLLFISTLLNAQGFGIQLGLNSSKLTGNQVYEKFDNPCEYPIKSSLKIGVNIGLNYDFKLSEKLYIQSGMYFSQKGTKGYFIYPSDFCNKKHWDLNVNYLEIPILIKYKYEINDKTSIFGLAGPSYNIGLKGELTTIYNNQDPNRYDLLLINNYEDKDDDSNTHEWKKTYLGFNIGAGIMYHNFEFKLIYTTGLFNTSIIDADYGYYSYKENFKQNVFSLNIGYRFIK